MQPIRTRDVATAIAACIVHASKMSPSTSWSIVAKWSITQALSKPASSVSCQ